MHYSNEPIVQIDRPLFDMPIPPRDVDEYTSPDRLVAALAAVVECGRMSPNSHTRYAALIAAQALDARRNTVPAAAPDDQITVTLTLAEARQVCGTLSVAVNDIQHDIDKGIIPACPEWSQAITRRAAIRDRILSAIDAAADHRADYRDRVLGIHRTP